MASSSTESSSSSSCTSSTIRSTLACKYCSSSFSPVTLSKVCNFARLIPSTRTLTKPPGNLLTCFTTTMVPTVYTSSCVGSSTATSFCATKNNFCSCIIACSTAIMDFCRLTSKCIIIFGKIVKPLSAMAGITSHKFISLVSMVFPLFYTNILLSICIRSFSSKRTVEYPTALNSSLLYSTQLLL